MANQDQRKNKMVKKPKKDSSPPKPMGSMSDRPVAPITVVPERGKVKK
jgi:hypothetical protein